MPVYGSYKDDNAFSSTRVSLMCRATVNESLDKIQELVRLEIVKFSDTGQLYGSVSKTGAKRISSSTWEGRVYSDLEYAAAIEYGMPPRVITPKKKQALKWLGEGGVAFSRGHAVSGFAGHHMFLKGSALFERTYAEDIAANNARAYLGALDAGRRTVVI